jgi:transmembrane sensor
MKSIRNDAHDSVFGLEGILMPTIDPSIEDEALAWVIRVRDPHFEDWDELTVWLENDAGHREAFDSLSRIDQDLAEIIPHQPANDLATIHPPLRRRSFLRGGFAAGAVAAMLAVGVFMASPSSYAIETGPGERRAIALADGTQVALNGSTRIRVDEADPRHVILEQGEAAFTVRHDDRARFTVRVGDDVFEDAGTVFNVLKTNQMVEVSVAEGIVIHNPKTAATRLAPGRAIRIETKSRRQELLEVSPASVGTWRRNQLVYNNDEIGRIASDISRATGTAVDPAPDVAGLRFTGTIQLERDTDQLMTRVAPVLGVKANRTADGWQLVRDHEADR